MKPPLSGNADRIGKITDILLGSTFNLGDRVWARTHLFDGTHIEGSGTIVESRTANRNPPFPYRHGRHIGGSVLVRFDDPPHDSGVNNGIWTNASELRHL